jgi:hypothetical protein
MMRAALILLLVVLTAVLAGAAQSRPARAVTIEELMLDAQRVPPEFEADALLRIAQSATLGEGRRRQILIDAFMRAYGAQEAYRRISFGVPPDSRQGALALTYDSRLTRVSLQVRAAQMLSIVDPRRARELFEWIEPGATATPCEESLVPALGEYYTTLSVLARTTFPASQRADALRFLEFYLWRAHLPSELPAIATAVLRFNPRQNEAQYFEGLLRFIMEGAARDPRGFAVTGTDIISKLGDLSDADHEKGVTGWHLLGAMRDYVKAQLTGPRCADSAAEPLALSAFNARLMRTDADRHGVNVLDGAQLRPSRLLPTARIDLFWQTVDSRRMHEEFLGLRGRNEKPVSMSLRQTREWQDRAERLVTELEQWTGIREPAGDFFYEKARLLFDLLELVPPGKVRDHALRADIEFLRRADMDRERRTLWFVFASRLIEQGRGTSGGESMLDAIEATGHPVLVLYAKLERLSAAQRRTN